MCYQLCCIRGFLYSGKLRCSSVCPHRVQCANFLNFRKLRRGSDLSVDKAVALAAGLDVAKCDSNALRSYCDCQYTQHFFAWFIGLRSWLPVKV